MRISLPTDDRGFVAHTSQKKRAVRKVIIPRAPGHAGAAGADLRNFIQSIYDAVLIVDECGLIVEANSRAATFFMKAEKDLVRTSLHHLIVGAEKSLMATIRQSLQQNRFVLIQAHCWRMDGTTFPVEISANILNSDQHRVCLFVRDVTVRRQAEEMMKTGFTAISNAAHGIAVTDVSGTLVYANAAMARLWSMESESSLVGMHIRDLWREPAAADGMVESVLGRRCAWHGQLLGARRDGGSFPVDVSAAVNANAEDHLKGMVLSFFDLTDRKRAEEFIRRTESNQAMLASLAAACHHIGQPGTVLLGNLSILESRLDEFEDENALLITECREAASQLALILAKMKVITEYRTVPYLDSAPSASAPSNQILDLGLSI